MRVSPEFNTVCPSTIHDSQRKGERARTVLQIEPGPQVHERKSECPSSSFASLSGGIFRKKTTRDQCEFLGLPNRRCMVGSQSAGLTVARQFQFQRIPVMQKR